MWGLGRPVTQGPWEERKEGSEAWPALRSQTPGWIGPWRSLPSSQHALMSRAALPQDKQHGDGGAASIASVLVDPEGKGRQCCLMVWALQHTMMRVGAAGLLFPGSVSPSR